MRNWEAIQRAAFRKLSPVYNVFLGYCDGKLDGDTLTVIADTPTSLRRLNCADVREALKEVSGASRVEIVMQGKRRNRKSALKK